LAFLLAGGALSRWAYVGISLYSTFFLDEESKQRNQEKTMLRPTWPSLTPLFFRACAHGIPLWRDALIDFLILFYDCFEVLLFF
jgi:hypothetical protein